MNVIKWNMHDRLLAIFASSYTINDSNFSGIASTNFILVAIKFLPVFLSLEVSPSFCFK